MHVRAPGRIAMAVLAGLGAACGSTSATTPTPTGPGSAAASASSTGAPTPPPATPTPTAAAGACTAADLNVVMGAESSASGGERGISAVFANHSSTACRLSGTLQIQLLDQNGAALPTSLTASSPGQAWLVPDRIALDPWWPQPGEATVQITWRTGDVQPGQCSGAAPPVSEVRLTVPGGGSLTGSPSPSSLIVAPCKGQVQLGAFTQAGAPPSYSTLLGATFSAIAEETGLQVTQTCTPTPQQQCLTTNTGPVLGGGGTAAYQQFNYGGTGGGAACFSYVYEDAAGWHPLDVACTQATGFNPEQGSSIAIFGPGSGCAPAHSSPSHTSLLSSCLSWSSNGSGTYTIDQGPTFSAEMDPTSNLSDGTVWWHLRGTGWVTQDFLVGAGAA